MLRRSTYIVFLIFCFCCSYDDIPLGIVNDSKMEIHIAAFQYYLKQIDSVIESHPDDIWISTVYGEPSDDMMKWIKIFIPQAKKVNLTKTDEWYNKVKEKGAVLIIEIGKVMLNDDYGKISFSNNVYYYKKHFRHGTTFYTDYYLDKKRDGWYIVRKEDSAMLHNY